MRLLWLFHRRALLLTMVAVVLVGTAIITAIDLTIGSEGSGGAASPPARVTPPAPPATTVPVSVTYAPSTVDPADTTTQTSIDHQLAAAESPSSIAQVEALVVPAAHDSTAYPLIALSSRRDPTTYARAFSAELLDRNYRKQSRRGLLGWAQGEEAANTLPGVPASAGGKALYASLADPAMAGGSDLSPVPAPDGWDADAKAGTTQWVSNVVVTVDPSWSRIVGEGWQPRDPLMTMMDVKAILAVNVRHHTVRRVVSMVIGLGSCAHQAGLGAVAVQDWALR
jgi:hypothetical protein